MIGRKLGHYTVVDRIGAGGMGEVFRAHDTTLGRDVALKVLPQDLAQDAERLARFEREARLLASVHHPNIAVVHGLETFDDLHVLVLELIAGEDLSQRLTRGAVPVDEALEIMRQVGEGLGAAHNAGILHRDLKPANIRLTPDGVAKVIDFGLARSGASAVGEPSDLSHSPTITHAATQSGIILGTAAYMSPEQARGKGVDRRADIFAFGTVLFELLSGKRVFAGETVSDTLAAVLRADPPWHELPRRTPQRVRELLRRCLDKDPRQRLQDIGEARIAIERVQAGDAGGEEVRSGGTMPRGRALLAIAAAVVVGLAVGRLLPRDTTAPLRRAPIHSEFLVNDHGFKNLSFSPDGRRLLYYDNQRLWIRDLDQFQPQPLPGSEGMHMAAWSPDGTQLVTTKDTYLYRMPATGGTATRLATLHDSVHELAGGLAWRTDDKIVFVTGSSGIYWIPATGGDPRVLQEVEEGYEDYHHLDLTGDGLGLLYAIHEPGLFHKIGWYQDGRTHVVFEDDQDVSFPAYSPTGHVVYRRRTSGLWAVAFDPRNPTSGGQPFLVSADGARADISADGTLAYVTNQENVPTHLVWYERNGSVADTIRVSDRSRDDYVSISPDGRYLIASELDQDNLDLWLYDLHGGGTQRRLTTDRGRDSHPVFSPDGTTVLYENRPQQQIPAELRTRTLDGRGSYRTLTHGSAASYSPDGKWIVFERAGRSFRTQILFMPADGSEEPRVLASHELVSLEAPTFSPDGRYVAYVNGDVGGVHLVSFPDGENRWQVTSDGGRDARWSAGAAALYYVASGKVMVVAIDTSHEVRIGAPRVVTARQAVRPIDAFVLPRPDGERVLVMQPVDPLDARPRIRLVQGWLQEVR